MRRQIGLALLSVGLGVTIVGCSSGGAGAESTPDGSAGGGSGPDNGGGSGGTSTKNGGGSGSGGTNPSNGSSSVSGDATHLTAKITKAAVLPGGEDHVCVVVELPNDVAVWASAVHATLGVGSHHLIVDRQPVGATLQKVPQSCTPTMAGDSTRLIIGQQKETTVTLPAGVAFKIEPHQPLFLQLHYFSTFSDTADITGEVELTLTDATAHAPVEAHSLFAGSLSINLPPHAAGTSSYFMMPTPDSGTRHVFALTSHTHSLGVDSTIERVPSESAASTTPVHESLNWSEPPLTVFSPPLDFTGKDGLRLTCKYMNTTEASVHFGTAFHDEMCFMWVYFYDQ